MDLKQFVQNRIVTIPEQSRTEHLHHIYSEPNPADVFARRMDPDRLMNCDVGWRGTFPDDTDYPCRM